MHLLAPLFIAVAALSSSVLAQNPGSVNPIGSFANLNTFVLITFSSNSLPVSLYFVKAENAEVIQTLVTDAFINQFVWRTPTTPTVDCTTDYAILMKNEWGPAISASFKFVGCPAVPPPVSSSVSSSSAAPSVSTPPRHPCRPQKAQQPLAARRAVN